MTKCFDWSLYGTLAKNRFSGGRRACILFSRCPMATPSHFGQHPVILAIALLWSGVDDPAIYDTCRQTIFDIAYDYKPMKMQSSENRLNTHPNHSGYVPSTIYAPIVYLYVKKKVVKRHNPQDLFAKIVKMTDPGPGCAQISSPNTRSR